ncbi:craniofacial development protein 2-like [Anabrus simplex]|uniref:craniofacial development protein 2-like n=1 Tax=Anabrus simplex TaxID=316456 RepID=UPI0035A372A3
MKALGGMEAYGRNKVELAESAKRVHMDVLGISDIRGRGGNEEEIGDYKLYLADVKKGRAESGVWLFIRNTTAHNIVSVRHINERMMRVDLAVGVIIMRIVSIYSPCEGAVEVEIDMFYEALSDIVVRVNRKDRIVLMSDFNVRVGKRTEGYERVIGKCGEDMESNRNGKRLLDFCASMCLAVTNTLKHKAIHCYTWEARGTRSIIDYILTDFEFRNSIRNVRVFWGFFDETDLCLICNELSISRPRIEKVKSVCK